MPLEDRIGQWGEFYVAAAGASAVLLGLVFVALSIHLDRSRVRLPVRGLAIEAATSLFYALIISLTMLIPEARPQAQAVLLFATALFGIWASGAAFIEARRRRPAPIAVALRFLLPWMAMFVLAIAGIGLAVSWGPATLLVGGVTIVHLIVGTQNAWDLLLGAAPPNER
jgi:hypothetical protein